MQIDRQQLASIGTDHLCQQLLVWQQEHLLQTSFSREEFPALVRSARRHGLPGQRGIAAWSLWLMKSHADPQARQCLDSWLATPSIGATERTLLMEIWLCQSQADTASAGFTSLSALVARCLDGSDTRRRSQLALHEAARTLQLTCDGMVQPLEQALSALPAIISFDGANGLQKPALALRDGLSPLLQSLRDSLAVVQQACSDPAPVHAAESLDECWQTLQSQIRHSVPRLIQAFESGLQDAEEQLPLGAMAPLEQAQACLARIDGLLACLPSALAGAIACTRIACLLRERGCVPALEALRQSLLEQNLQAVDAEGDSHAWYSSLSRLPEDFRARTAPAVAPLNNPVDPLHGHGALDSALAQAALFNALQALENLLKPALDALSERHAPCPDADYALPVTAKPSADVLGNAMAQLDEHIATLNSMIVALEQDAAPGPAWATALEEVQQSLSELTAAVQRLETPGATPSPAQAAFHRCADLLSRNLHESAALLATWSTP